ncbi:hypothetical protein Verru16b_01526 [Lacunisphaera limnophila]|uniref:Carbohydrate binding domain protein n=1 Tax=Lacunisphaera limnophila TaxID=1838286 RepID=A0A1D8AU89_9BACT|nr:hypothetical protein [Lacunisphaera limnophila]AOS44464.1 hypothetical protein Verru16b_01526 [Lacunisphaera limnophila]
MMASVILVVGFMGMIQAVTIGSEMLATARRQTLAAQILNHEMEKLRLISWTSMPATATDVTVGIDCTFWPTWVGGRNYAVNEVVTYNGAWYRCTVASPANTLPTDTGFWTATTTALSTDIVNREGVVLSLERTTVDLIASEMKEISFTIEWTKGGTTTAAATATGTWLQRLSFQGSAPIARTYTRRSTTWFTKYGLNHAIQRS